MLLQILTLGRLADAAGGGLIVLAVGSLAVRLCWQPVRRARLVVLTLLGAVAVPCLSALPVGPRWSAGLLPAPLDVRSGTEVLVLGDSSSPLRVPEAARTSAARKFSERRGETPAPVRSPAGSTARSGPVQPAGSGRWSASFLPTALLLGYLAMTAGLAAWWFAGQVLLWRVTRAARPVPGDIRDFFLGLAGPGSERVVLLASDRIALPFTYTWLRPVILLPAALCEEVEPEALRYILAHEWSHVERRDAWAWNLACVAGLVLFYQPLFWWLRRQLRLCQDYLADARAAAAGSAEDYASFLIRLARVHRSRLTVPALGIGDRRSNLSRRVTMLALDHEPLEHRCRAAWSIAVAVIVIIMASGLRLSAGTPAAVDDDQAAAAKEVKAAAPAEVENARTWHGRVTERGTGKPIAGADVVVEISVSRNATTGEPQTLREVHHTTGADGSYQFTITPAEAAERLLYITLQAEAPDHVGFFGGYGYGMLLKNEKLGERPFYENLELAPGKAIEGLVFTPEGKPAAGVKVQAFSAPDAERIFDNARWAETRTDAQGHFRLVLHPKGKAVFWLLPQEYAPETHGLKNDRRGDLGKFTLENGIRFGGRLLDAQGKPVAGVYVEADLETNTDGNDDAVPPGVADMKHRSTITQADGSFSFRPLPPGTCRVYASERGWDPTTREGAHDPARRPLPGVFIAHRVNLEEGKTPDPVEIRGVPHVIVEAQIYNSKGEPRGGHEIDLFGQFDGGFWNASCRPTEKGAYRILAPHGLDEARIMLVTNEHTALQFRTSKGAPLQHRREIKLGTLDHDVKGIEIVRFEAPVILINATTKDGKQLRGFQAAVDYTAPQADRDGKFIVKAGMRSDVSLEEQADGRYRTSQLVPDREVMVTIKAGGYAPASRKVTLAEGKVEEVTLVLAPH